MENTASTVTLNHAGQSRKSKQISSHVTDDGVNYRTPECRKVSAKKTDSSTGRRKQWSKPAPNGYPFPSSTPGTHRSEDSLNPDTSRTLKMSEYDFGFQQRIVRFDEEPPKPPSVSFCVSLTVSSLKNQFLNSPAPGMKSTVLPLNRAGAIGKVANACISVNVDR